MGGVRAGGAILALPHYLWLKAHALYLANRTPEALEVIKEADALVEKYELYHMRSALYRLRGVFLAAMGVDEAQIEGSFQAAIRIAKENSVSLGSVCKSSM